MKPEIGNIVQVDGKNFRIMDYLPGNGMTLLVQRVSNIDIEHQTKFMNDIWPED